jgi:hypothetical protein
MRAIGIVLFAFALLAAAPADVTSQTLTGTVTGTVTDVQGAVLPGVTVTLTGRTGSQTQVTDENGVFRFLAVNPGIYTVRTELSGFRPYQENVDVGVSRTVSVRATMALGGIQESIEVVASPLNVDTTSTATETTISQDLLFSMPISRTNAATGMLNYAPGVNSGSAFGGSANTGNALLLDGVDTGDPDGNSAWTFFNYNIIDEVQVGGLGQPAEYGGFTGAVVNTITKSGGNRYSGLFEHRYTNGDLRGDNISDDVRDENPTLLVSGVDKLNDYTVQLGGPIRRDKAFFFGSIQRYSIQEDPAGPRTIRTEVSPRFNTKVTLQPTTNDTVVGTFQYDQYNQTGRTSAFGGAAGTTDERTVVQDSPEFIWNGQYRKVMGSSSFFEAKFTGYWGYFDLDPVTIEPLRIQDDGSYEGGAGYSAKYDRMRNQLNAAFSKYVDAKGTHNFKFGVEIERSGVRNRSTYTDDIYYYDVGGEPYLAYNYSYDIKGDNRRTTLYAQDQWTAGRVTANLGLRFDGLSGEGGDEIEHYKTNSISPRLGVAVDLTGDGRSVLRAYYGQLYKGALFEPWSRAVGGASDFVTYSVDAANRLTEIDRQPHELKYQVVDDINHPRTDEFNVAYERQLFGRWKGTATYIRRTAKNFVNSVLTNAVWVPTTVTNAKTNQPMTVYRWSNRGDQQFLIQNVDDVSFGSIGSAETEREYNGVMFVVQRPMQNRWQAQISYVFSRTEGLVSSGGSTEVNSTQFETPNTVLINRGGRVNLDRPHEFKLFVGYQIPVVEVGLNTYWRSTSGTTYEPFQRIAAGNTLGWPSSVDVYIEPQGSYRNDHLNVVDLRLEKYFSVGFNRFGIYADLENAFNVGTVTTRQTRFPGANIALVRPDGSSESHFVDFGHPTAVTAARQITFGGRWSF